jgi:hypothetical protein
VRCEAVVVSDTSAGAAIAYGLYHEFRGDPGVQDISFGVYMLFIGVAMAITVGARNMKPCCTT